MQRNLESESKHVYDCKHLVSPSSRYVVLIYFYRILIYFYRIPVTSQTISLYGLIHVLARPDQMLLTAGADQTFL